MSENHWANIARTMSDIKPEPTTQDKCDQLASELATAGYMRAIANKRYERVKAEFIDNFNDVVKGVRDRAREEMTQCGVSVKGTEWLVEVSAKTPVISIDNDKFQTELVKLGVSRDIIAKAAKAAQKMAAPATFFECIETNA